MLFPIKDLKATAKQVIILMTVVVSGLSFYVLLTQISGILTIRDFESRFVSQLLFLLVKVWLPWVILSPIVVFFALRFPLLPDNWLSRSLIHFSALMGLSLIHMALVSYHYHYFEDMSPVMATYQSWQHIGHFLFGDSIFLYNTIIYTLLVASFNLKIFYMLAQSRGVEAESLSHKLTESKLHALRMQVNPHFLFNTLNMISVLVMKGDNDKAVNTIGRLSGFFRATLEESKNQWVPLSQELEMIGQYLDIARLRFGDRLTINEHYKADAMLVQIPSMILQPLVENSIRHGFAESAGACKLSLLCKLEGDYLIIEIVDNGVGCDFYQEGFVPGVGLSNVEQRLKQLYSDNQCLRFDSMPGEGATARLKLSILEGETRSYKAKKGGAKNAEAGSEHL